MIVGVPFSASPPHEHAALEVCGRGMQEASTQVDGTGFTSCPKLLGVGIPGDGTESITTHEDWSVNGFILHRLQNTKKCTHNSRTIKQA
jgi:hypothetical protein